MSHLTSHTEAGSAQLEPDATGPADGARGRHSPHAVPVRFWPFLQKLLLLVGVYVLSIGPFYWHWYGSRFGLGSKATAVFYEPIVVVAQVVPGFGRWLDWYVGLWIS